MDSVPKLIFLNGFAGCGKTTLAKRYIDEHPLALNIEGDELIGMLGQWKQHNGEAVTCKLALSESMAQTHLNGGHDVVLPFLLVDPKHADTYESIATKTGARFFEIMLAVDKDEAVRRLLKRGSWGEAELPPLDEHNQPEIENLYDRMTAATAERPNTINIHPHEGAIDATYHSFIEIVEKIRCGYQEEGRLKRHIFRDGDWHDEVLMAVFREDWLPLWAAYRRKS